MHLTTDTPPTAPGAQRRRRYPRWQTNLVAIGTILLAGAMIVGVGFAIGRLILSAQAVSPPAADCHHPNRVVVAKAIADGGVHAAAYDVVQNGLNTLDYGFTIEARQTDHVLAVQVSPGSAPRTTRLCSAYVQVPGQNGQPAALQPTMVQSDPATGYRAQALLDPHQQHWLIVIYLANTARPIGAPVGWLPPDNS